MDTLSGNTADSVLNAWRSKVCKVYNKQRSKNIYKNVGYTVRSWKDEKKITDESQILYSYYYSYYILYHKNKQQIQRWVIRRIRTPFFLSSLILMFVLVASTKTTQHIAISASSSKSHCFVLVGFRWPSTSSSWGAETRHYIIIDKI